MKSKRFKFSKSKSNKEFDIDITSLLDVLVILLVFLLKSYNASDLKLTMVDKLNVAPSRSQKLGNHHAVIHVNSESYIWVENKKIGQINDRTLASVGNELIEVSRKKKSKKDTLVINLVIDEKLKYNVVKKIMNTAADSGFGKFNLIVRGDYQ